MLNKAIIKLCNPYLIKRKITMT